VTQFGPRLTDKGVLFRLWAPNAQDILLEVKDQGAFSLAATGDGWHQLEVPCQIGARYRFRLGDTSFPDPASRRQDGGVHGWSVVCAPMTADPRWLGRPWHETVLYECHPGLMGGFAGLAEKLPALKDLGITAIELMPIAAFPGAHNWGYDGVLHFAPAEAYGTPEDLKALVDQAHGLGMMIFLDVVYNHFGPDGNYLSLYAGNFFRTDTPTPWGAAIDFRVPQVGAFFAENAHQWLLEYGFDGLRFDAVHAIRDEGWLDRMAKALRQRAGKRCIHLVLENEDNIAGHLRSGFDAQWNDDIHHALHVLLTGETNGYYQDFAADPAAKLARGLAEGFIYQGDTSANRNGAPRGEISRDLPPTAFVAFLQNHDQIGNRAFGDRITTLADPEAVKAAIALLLLMPQIPMIFMGEEIGSRAPFLYFTDHGPELATAVREGRRREFAAFADAAHGRDIPDPNSATSFESSRPEQDAPEAEAWRDFYRQLLDLRRQHLVPFLKGARALGADPLGTAAVMARWQLDNGLRLTIAANLGETPVPAVLPKEEPFWGQSAGALPPYTTLAWIHHG
jgi:maltooligosyltrehalose trehalohydrolase